MDDERSEHGDSRSRYVDVYGCDTGDRYPLAYPPTTRLPISAGLAVGWVSTAYPVHVSVAMEGPVPVEGLEEGVAQPSVLR